MLKTNKRGNPICVGWVTKYALTQGIFKVEGEICVGIDPNMFSFKRGYDMSVFKNEWFRTEAEALEHVEVMRAKKIASLNRNIDKLKNLNIEIINF